MSHPATLTARSTTSRVRRRGAGALVGVLLTAVVLGACMPDDARTFLDRTNAVRRSVGVAALKEHPTLTDKAESWARHLASIGRLEHSTLSAGLGSLRWTALAENVGYSTPTSNTLLTIHNNFVRSAGHYANLVNPKYTHMGVGVAKDSAGRIWVVEVFARL
jgi:uncharacterized protein YkwD